MIRTLFHLSVIAQRPALMTLRRLKDSHYYDANLGVPLSKDLPLPLKIIFFSIWSSWFRSGYNLKTLQISLLYCFPLFNSKRLNFCSPKSSKSPIHHLQHTFWALFSATEVGLTENFVQPQGYL